jgi:hypothetical protein
MSDIKIEKFDVDELARKGITSWPIWEKGISEFDWSYDSSETCYVIEGKAEVTTNDGERVEFGKGDKVIFPEGLDCKWKIISPVKKYYDLG